MRMRRLGAWSRRRSVHPAGRREPAAPRGPQVGEQTQLAVDLVLDRITWPAGTTCHDGCPDAVNVSVTARGDRTPCSLASACCVIPAAWYRAARARSSSAWIWSAVPTSTAPTAISACATSGTLPAGPRLSAPAAVADVHQDGEQARILGLAVELREIQPLGSHAHITHNHRPGTTRLRQTPSRDGSGQTAQIGSLWLRKSFLTGAGGVGYDAETTGAVEGRRQQLRADVSAVTQPRTGGVTGAAGPGWSRLARSAW
jgi:hypothetical protein